MLASNKQVDYFEKIGKHTKKLLLCCSLSAVKHKVMPLLYVFFPQYGGMVWVWSTACTWAPTQPHACTFTHVHTQTHTDTHLISERQCAPVHPATGQMVQRRLGTAFCLLYASSTHTQRDEHSLGCELSLSSQEHPTITPVPSSTPTWEHHPDLPPKLYILHHPLHFEYNDDNSNTEMAIALLLFMSFKGAQAALLHPFSL